MLQITAPVHEVRATENVNTRSGNVFAKRLLVLNNSRTLSDGRTIESYVPITFTAERCALLDSIRPGQRVCVSFDLNGRYYQPKNSYFIDVVGLQIMIVDSAPMPSAAPPIPTAPTPPPAAPSPNGDLPW